MSEKFEKKDPLSWMGFDINSVDKTDEPFEIDIAKIEIKEQPRKELKGIIELAESIESVGLLEPIVVKETNGSYLLICGERRLAATKSLGLEKIKAVKIDIPDEDIPIVQIIENIQRESLSPVELANAYAKLNEKWPVREIAKRLNVSKSHVQDTLTLLDLPEGFKPKIKKGNVGKMVELARSDKDIQDKFIGNIDDISIAEIKNKKFEGRDFKSFVEEFNSSHKDINLTINVLKHKTVFILKTSKKNIEKLIDKIKKM